MKSSMQKLNEVRKIRYISIILLMASSLGYGEASVSDRLVSSESFKQLDQCPSWQPGQVVTLNESLRLPSGCSYTQVRFQIKKSDVLLDCNNAILNSTGFSSKKKDFEQYTQNEAPLDWAFKIYASDEKILENIEVRNCQIKNYIDGVRIQTNLDDYTKKQLKFGGDNKTFEDRLRSIAPQNIKLSNLIITDSHKHGIYIDRYVNNVSIKNGEVNNSGNSGIYLESGTQNVSVENIKLEHNGFSYYDKANRISWPRFGILRREAIAVDSSANNKITNNLFKNNGYGAVFLYKNCYEHYTDSAQLPRLQHADNNQISNNQFLSEKYGVWVASRQSRDLASFECGDSLVYSWFLLKFYEDYAENNTIQENLFDNVEYGVTIEDNNNFILSNKFTGKSKKDIKVGSQIRTLINNPVTNVVTRFNYRY